MGYVFSSYLRFDKFIKDIDLRGVLYIKVSLSRIKRFALRVGETECVSL